MDDKFQCYQLLKKVVTKCYNDLLDNNVEEIKKVLFHTKDFHVFFYLEIYESLKKMATIDYPLYKLMVENNLNDKKVNAITYDLFYQVLWYNQEICLPLVGKAHSIHTVHQKGNERFKFEKLDYPYDFDMYVDSTWSEEYFRNDLKQPTFMNTLPALLNAPKEFKLAVFICEILSLLEVPLKEQPKKGTEYFMKFLEKRYYLIYKFVKYSETINKPLRVRNGWGNIKENNRIKGFEREDFEAFLKQENLYVKPNEFSDSTYLFCKYLESYNIIRIRDTREGESPFSVFILP